MDIAYTNHIGHSSRDENTGKNTIISTINDLAAVEKHNNHDYTIDDVSRMQSNINLNLKTENSHYEIKDGKLSKVEGYFDIEANVRKIYEEQFAEAIAIYNEKQIEAGHPERQITSYIDKISENKQQEVAVEGLIQFGSLEDWENKSLEEKRKVAPLLLKGLEYTLHELKGTDREFILAGASLHLNEGSPHLHYVGVPVQNTPGATNGLQKRVKKSAVFTKESLGTGLQDNVRAKIEPELKSIFGWEFEEKKTGRNDDLEKNIYVNTKLKEQIREGETYIETITKQGQEYIEEHKKQRKELEDNILELQDQQFFLMTNINSIIGNEAGLLEEMIDNTVDNVLINQSSEYNDFCLYMSYCSDEEREETSKKIRETKEKLIWEEVDIDVIKDGLDAFVKRIETRTGNISWQERQEFWYKYNDITAWYWNVYPSLQKDYKIEISKAYDEKYILSQAYYDTLHTLRVTNNLFIMLYLAVKVFFLAGKKCFAETELNELLKERKKLIKSAASFKGFCTKYREELKQGKAPNERYLKAMTKLVKMVDERRYEFDKKRMNLNDVPTERYDR